MLSLTGWATLTGRLAAHYPQLVALNVDDMSHDLGVGNPFPPNLVARMTSQLRGQGAPWMALASAIYYSQDDVWSFGLWPDVPMVLDAPTFCFRNEFQGIGPCVSTADRACPWGPMKKTAPTEDGPGGCLAGACADPTVINAAFEVAHMNTRVPVGRSLMFEFYVTGHSTLGQPTPTYVSGIMQQVEHLPGISGMIVYTTKSTPADNPECTGLEPPLFGGEMGCIVRDAYRRLRGDYIYK